MTTAVSNDEIHQPSVNMLEELGNIVEGEFNLEQFRTLTNKGFLYLIQGEKTNNHSNKINSGIAISEFLNYKENDKQILLQLFCLTITLLNRSKDEINKIGKKDEKETLYDKLVDGLIVKLKEKL